MKNAWCFEFVVLLTLGICVSTCSGRDEERSDRPSTAWWLELEIPATATEIESIPVGELQEGWRRASLVSMASIPVEFLEDGNLIAEQGFEFSMPRDLDRDGRAERIAVGSYETTSGAKGAFLLVLPGAVGGQPAIVGRRSGAANFSILLEVAGEVRWYACMECGEYETLQYSKGSGQYFLD